jgi:hypothetical protein
MSVTPKIYCHYTSPAAAQSIAATQELWGKQSGLNGLGGVAARAYDGPHDANGIKSMSAVDFTTHVPPTRRARNPRGTVYLWTALSAGVKIATLPSGDDVVKVPIQVQGVYP